MAARYEWIKGLYVPASWSETNTSISATIPLAAPWNLQRLIVTGGIGLTGTDEQLQPLDLRMPIGFKARLTLAAADGEGGAEKYEDRVFTLDLSTRSTTSSLTQHAYTIWSTPPGACDFDARTRMAMSVAGGSVQVTLAITNVFEPVDYSYGMSSAPYGGLYVQALASHLAG